MLDYFDKHAGPPDVAWRSCLALNPILVDFTLRRHLRHIAYD
ncbi:hypothetical protein ACTZWY_17010 [Roseinatronobacter sp. NSM]